MDIKQLKNWLKDITVQNQVNADVEVVNNSPLIMLGKGRQGAVFQVTDDICVKVFGNEEDCEREHYALSLGKDTNLFPKIHAKGPLYLAMDIVRGVDIREYLQSQPLTESLSAKLLDMLITFKKIGYERIDHHKRQIYLQPDGSLKVIDVARTVWRDRVYPYPRKLLTSLGEENKAIFLGYVQEVAPEVYAEWLHYIRMEEVSHQIYQILLPEKPDKETLKNLSEQLLTTEEEAKYVAQLQGLVHKVFKEEWVKTMLARGKDPEAVMKKIDEYWDSREMEVFREGNRKGDKDGYRDRKEGKRFVGESRRDDKHYNRNRFEGDKYHDRVRKSGPKDRKRRHHS